MIRNYGDGSTLIEFPKRIRKLIKESASVITRSRSDNFLKGKVAYGQAKSVLVVEDDDGIWEAVQVFLEIEGYRTITAADGRQGLEAL